jgi:hypothetical protein
VNEAKQASAVRWVDVEARPKPRLNLSHHFLKEGMHVLWGNGVPDALGTAGLLRSYLFLYSKKVLLHGGGCNSSGFAFAGESSHRAEC